MTRNRRENAWFFDKLCYGGIYLSCFQRKRVYKSGITRWHLIGEVMEVDCNKKHVFSLCLHRFSLVFDAFVLYLTYFTRHFTLNVRILGEVQPAELIDRGEILEFFKLIFSNSKNDMESVWENSKNVARVPDGWDLDLRIFLWRIFPQPGMDLAAARVL